MRLFICILLAFMLAMFSMGITDYTSHNSFNPENMTAYLIAQGYTKYELERDMASPLKFIGKGTVKGDKIICIIDTGASHTVISKTTAQRLGLPLERMRGVAVGLSSKTQELFACEIDEWKLNGKTLPKQELVAMDLEMYNTMNREHGASEVDIILGGEFLLRYEAIISCPDKSLFLRN